MATNKSWPFIFLLAGNYNLAVGGLLGVIGGQLMILGCYWRLGGHGMGRGGGG